jgi:mannosyltransferase
VPVLYLLGRRSAGSAAGLVAAAIWVLSIFGIFYGTEARAYALLALLSAASTLVLLEALRHGGRGHWTLFALLTAGILYTHYTGVGVVVAQAGWALAVGAGRRRAILLANAGALLLFAPWLPYVRKDGTVEIYEAVGPRDLGGYVAEVGHAFPGHPILSLQQLPGTLAVVVLAGALVAAGAGALAERRPRLGVLAASPAGLLVVVALATPVALALLSLQADGGAFLARSLSPSLPAILVLVAAALTAPRRRLAIAVTATFLAVLGYGAVRVDLPGNRRPDYVAFARFIDERAKPGDPVLVFSLFDPKTASGDYMSVLFARPYPERRFRIQDAGVWRDPSLTAPQVFAVLPTGTPLPYLGQPPGPPGRYRVAEIRPGRGFGHDQVVSYRRR